MFIFFLSYFSIFSFFSSFFSFFSFFFYFSFFSSFFSFFSFFFYFFLFFFFFSSFFSFFFYRRSNQRLPPTPLPTSAPHAALRHATRPILKNVGPLSLANPVYAHEFIILFMFCLFEIYEAVVQIRVTSHSSFSGLHG